MSDTVYKKPFKLSMNWRYVVNGDGKFVVMKTKDENNYFLYHLVNALNAQDNGFYVTKDEFSMYGDEIKLGDTTVTVCGTTYMMRELGMSADEAVRIQSNFMEYIKRLITTEKIIWNDGYELSVLLWNELMLGEVNSNQEKNG